MSKLYHNPEISRTFFCSSRPTELCTQTLPPLHADPIISQLTNPHMTLYFSVHRGLLCRTLTKLYTFERERDIITRLLRAYYTLIRAQDVALTTLLL